MPNHSSKPKRPRDINQLAKAIVDQATAEPTADVQPTPQEAAPEPLDPIREAARALGKRGGLKGGKARAASMTPERRPEIAKKAAAARWTKTQK